MCKHVQTTDYPEWHKPLHQAQVKYCLFYNLFSSVIKYGIYILLLFDIKRGKCQGGGDDRRQMSGVVRWGKCPGGCGGGGGGGARGGGGQTIAPHVSNSSLYIKKKITCTNM